MPRHHPSLSSLGEFGEIERLKKRLGPAIFSEHILRSIGDDAALVRPPRGSDLLLTTDALIEGVHFSRAWDSARDIGWKAIVANLSDIAAMNGAPLCAVVSLGLPARTPVAWTDDLYRGMRDAARAYSTPIVGGDTVRSPRDIMISVALVGCVRPLRSVMRFGARVGDLVYVTGELGTCAAALELLQNVKRGRSTRSAIFRKHRKPRPRFDVLEALRRAKIRPTAMIDISDGLISDLLHIGEQSGVGFELTAANIPILPALGTLAKARKRAITDWTLNSGEEYELLMTVAPRHARAMALLPSCTLIGRVVQGTGVTDMSSHGARLQPRGFEHF